MRGARGRYDRALVKRRPPPADEDWMRSVADIPPDDDADDELSGISPELVLVDPELARLVRERESSYGAPAPLPPRRAATLRLVPTPAVEPGIVPRPAPSGPPAGAEPEPQPAVDAGSAASSTPPPPPPPVIADAAPAATPAVELSERVVDAEPARAVAPPRPPIPTPLAEPVRRPTAAPSSARSALQAVGSTAEPVMPHPVKRTSVAPRPVRALPPGRSGRRVLALLGGVAVASAVVLALLQLTGGPSETSQTAAGPRAKSPATGAPHAAPTGEARPPAKVPARAKAKTKPASKPKTVAKEKAGKATRPKPSATAKPGTAKTAPATASAAPPATRRFAWAPVDGAIGYHVELFKGDERVLVRETKKPMLELDPTWRYEGRTMTLTPGEYRWYVWPVTKSGRAAQAVVQAKLTV